MLEMLTIDEAKGLQFGDIICQTNRTGSDGRHVRWRVSGMVQTWKRDAGRIRVPLKHGLRSYDAITESDFTHNGTSHNLRLARNCDCGNS